MVDAWMGWGVSLWLSTAATGASVGPTEPSDPPTAAASPTGPAAPGPSPSSPSSSPAPRPRHRMVYNNLVVATIAPVGAADELNLGYRYQLVDRRTPLFDDSFVAVLLHTFATPAYTRVGPRLEIQPVAPVNLSVTYDFVGYYGALLHLQSFQSPTDDWSFPELVRRDAVTDPATRNYATTGHYVTLSALLQGKLGRFAMRDNPRFYWSDYDLRAGDTVAYDPVLDIPTPDRGWALSNDLDVFYLFDFGLVVAARYTLFHAFYQPRHFAPGEPSSRPNGPTHRLGPALLYTFYDRPDRRFNRPTLFVLSQWWLAHRFRTGQTSSQAIPFFVLGLLFQGDLLPHPRTWNAKTERRRRRATHRVARLDP